MTVKLLIAVWQRLETTKICYEGVNRLIAHAKTQNVTIEPLILVSEQQHIELAEQYEFEHIFTQNRPLGRKLNEGLKYVLACDFDYMMQLGSDDLLTNKGLDLLIAEMQKEKPFFGFTRLYVTHIHDTEIHKCKFTGVFGAGRCISKAALLKASRQREVLIDKTFKTAFGILKKGKTYFLPEKKVSKYFKKGVLIPLRREQYQLWQDDLNKGLDFNSELAIWRAGFGNAQAVKTNETHIIDIKDAHSISKYDYFKMAFPAVEKFEKQDIFKRFKELEMLTELQLTH